jgi:hypothetical protein
MGKRFEDGSYVDPFKRLEFEGDQIEILPGHMGKNPKS